MGRKIEQLRASREKTDHWRAVEHAAFVPSTCMERLVLQVIGAWQNLLGELNFSRFMVHDDTAKWDDDLSPAKAVRELAERSNVRWPHDQWSNFADEANDVRQRLAHMLHIDTISGETPNQTMTFWRLGRPDQPKRRRGEPPVELARREKDLSWSQQYRQIDTLTEQQLRDVLGKVKWMIACVRGMMHIRRLLEQAPDIADDHEVDRFMWQVNWWLPEWGANDRQLYVKDIRIALPQ